MHDIIWFDIFVVLLMVTAAWNIHLSELRESLMPITVLATAAVVIDTVIVALGARLVRHFYLRHDRRYRTYLSSGVVPKTRHGYN